MRQRPQKCERTKKSNRPAILSPKIILMNIRFLVYNTIQFFGLIRFDWRLNEAQIISTQIKKHHCISFHVINTMDAAFSQLAQSYRVTSDVLNVRAKKKNWIVSHWFWICMYWFIPFIVFIAASHVSELVQRVTNLNDENLIQPMEWLILDLSCFYSLSKVFVCDANFKRIWMLSSLAQQEKQLILSHQFYIYTIHLSVFACVVWVVVPQHELKADFDRSS